MNAPSCLLNLLNEVPWVALQCLIVVFPGICIVLYCIVLVTPTNLFISCANIKLRITDRLDIYQNRTEQNFIRHKLYN